MNGDERKDESAKTCRETSRNEWEDGRTKASKMEERSREGR